MSGGPPGGQKRALDALELELPVVVSLLVWMLGTECVSPERTASVFNH